MKKLVTLSLFVFFILLVLQDQAFASLITLADGDTINSCKTYKEYVDANMGDFCWACDLFEIFFDAGNMAAGKIAGALWVPLKSVIAIGFVLQIAYHVTSVYAKNGTLEFEFGPWLTQFSIMCFKVVVCYLFLDNSCDFIFSYIIGPLVNTGTDLASSMLDSECNVSGSGAITADGPLSGSKPGLMCVIRQLSDSFAEPQAIASALRCGGLHWKKATIKLFGELGEIPNPLMMGWGCTLGLLYSIGTFVMPLLMLDIIFRMCIIIGMTPIFVAAWTFPVTAKFTYTALKIIWHCCLTFACGCAIFGMLLTLTMNIWLEEAGSSGESSFFGLIITNNYIPAYDLIRDNENFFLIVVSVIVVAVLVAYMPTQVEEFSSNFSGVSSIKSCADRALKGTVNFFIDIIILFITIFTAGCSCFLYCRKFANYIRTFNNSVKQLEETKKKIENARKRIEESKARIERLKKLQNDMQKAKNLVS